MPTVATQDHRVAFDFEIHFSNGGGLKGWDFRLDIEGREIEDAELAAYIVRDLRLLMVGSVSILNKRVFAEAHKRNAAASARQNPGPQIPRRELFDLSHTVRSGDVTYPGLPAVTVTEHLSHSQALGRYAEGVSFQIPYVAMVANTGTALDAPLHRYTDREDVAQLSLGSSTDLDAIVVRLSGMEGRAVTRLALAPAIEDAAGKAVLIETEWSRKWGDAAYFDGHPYLTADAAEYLKSLGVALVGIDSLNIDDTADPSRPAHSILLAAGIPIVENLTGLAALPLSGLRFSAAPLKIAAMGACAVRAWAVAV